MAPTAQKKKTDLGAGLRISKQNIEDHPAGPPKHGELSQAERAFTLASTFMSGVLAISASQFLGAPLKLIDPGFYDAYMAYTKECFAVLITCLTQWWAPTVVRVSGDSSMLGQLVKRKDGSLECKFASRMVMMANHQLYTDWLYLWWIAYTNKMHGYIYIILKESLKSIPIIGWGCQFYNFIFLSRKWEDDKQTFKTHLAKLSNPKDPMWLIIFPEGTNLSTSTKEKSKKWAEKTGVPDMKHQLLPRSTGLRFCLQELQESTDWLYDCTIAYEGVPPGQFGQDIFTLRSSFFEGRPPKSVNMHWRRFRIDTIPINNSKAFEVWLRNRWREKDYMLEYFQRNNRFPADDFWKDHLDMGSQSSSTGGKSLRSVPKPAIQIETEVKSGNWNEFVKIFAPITSIIMALTVAYGASPSDLPFPGGKDFLAQHMQGLLSGGEMKGLPSPDQLEKFIVDAAKMGLPGTKPGAKPVDAEQVQQQLTQENLARLVKETAIQHGMVLPGDTRRMQSALPAMTAPPQKAKQVPATKGASKAKSAVNKPSTPNKTTVPVEKTTKPDVTTPAKAPVTKPRTTPAKTPAAAKRAPAGEMQTVTTKTGVKIKIPKSEVEQAKKTGTVVTKNGLVIKIGQDELDEAQKRKGTTVMTSGGIPITITPSGAMTVAPKAGAQAQSKAPANATKKTPTSTPSKGIPVVNKAASKLTTAPKMAPQPQHTAGPKGVTKKTLAPGGNVQRPARPLGKTETPQAVNKKTG